MNEDVNKEITNRIATIEDNDIRSFLEDVVSYERQVLAKTQPHYKRKYRRLAQQYLDERGNDE